MELRTYYTILARRWKVMFLVFIVISGIFAYGSQYILPTYQAEASLRVVTPLAGSLGDTYHETTFANRLINTYAQIATSEQVMNDLKKRLNLETLPDISVSIIPDSEIILILVEDSNPSLAAETANELADVIISKQDEVLKSDTSSEELSILTDRRNELETELTQARTEQNRLIPIYSRSVAQIELLDRAIRMKEEFYQTFLSQNRLDDMKRTEKELEVLNKQYEELSTTTNEYMQQLAILEQTIQNDQSAYSDLLYRYDNVLGANLRQQRTEDIYIVGRAITPTVPSGLGRLFVIGLGVICGLIGGIVLAFLFDNLDTRIFTSEQISRTMEIPILGRFPQIQDSKNQTTALNSEYPTIHRDYWMLCTRILSVLQNKSVKTILVTSPNPMEGKSTVASGIATGLARNKCKVLIVDADLRKPHQQKFYRVSAKQGLSDFLSNKEIKVEDVIQQNVRPGIDLLPSLVEYSDPTDLFQSPQLGILFEKMKAYDVVLLDAPALLAAPDAYNLAVMVDGVLIVVQRGLTTNSDLRAICDHLEAVGSKLLGVVINQVPVKANSDYYHKKNG